mgnify:CR=1 FL=1
MLRCVRKPHSATLRCSHTMVNQFDTGVLFIVESTGEKVVVHQHVYALCFEILQLVKFQLLAKS